MASVGRKKVSEIFTSAQTKLQFLAPSNLSSANLVLRLHRHRRRHRRLPTRRHTLPQRHRPPPRARRLTPRQPQHHPSLRLRGALSDLSHYSPSQRFISEDGVINARARVLGGGSCINAGFYSRASADYVRAAGWDARLVNESYRWVEKVVAFQPPMKQWQSAVRDGLLEAGVEPNNGFTYDHLVGTKVGGTIFDGEGGGVS
ncbi:UNVERIFIED_CONTAM: protein HOTHEAD [Sesamum latifolium]|uniref:Protein HOTHEAD n=1 Tax=Sesamum latifolium TaxID=2727402 RepID=A0AAW2WV98_9LAMI